MFKKILLMVKLLKAGSYDKIMDALLPYIFESPKVAPFLAKNKTIIGFLLQAVAAVLTIAQTTFPSEPWIPIALTVIGLVLQALGIAHRGVKDRAA